MLQAMIHCALSVITSFVCFHFVVVVVLEIKMKIYMSNNIDGVMSRDMMSYVNTYDIVLKTKFGEEVE